MPLSVTGCAEGFVGYQEFPGQFFIRGEQLRIAAATGSDLSQLRIRCLSSCLVCDLRRRAFDVNLLGFAILAGDAQHVEDLVSQMRCSCPLVFPATNSDRPAVLHNFSAPVRGRHYDCGGLALYSNYCCCSRERRESVKAFFASEDRRRVVAAAALRKALHLSYRHAVEIYGMVLVQLTRQSFRLQEEVLWRILTFASDVPQIVEALGISELSEAVTGWDCDVFQRQSLLHRIISVVQQEYIYIPSAGARLLPRPAGYENWQPQASFSASGTRQPQASGPPGLSGEYKGGDVPEPMVDTALHRFPPHVCDQRLSEHRSAPVVLL